jgi:hypothetical protein
VAVPVLGSGHRFAKRSGVLADEHDRRTLGYKTRSLLGHLGHFCTKRAKRVGSA